MTFEFALPKFPGRSASYQNPQTILIKAYVFTRIFQKNGGVPVTKWHPYSSYACRTVDSLARCRKGNRICGG
jgi:hypothetical protein